jgi:hypothetical protein
MTDPLESANWTLKQKEHFKNTVDQESFLISLSAMVKTSYDRFMERQEKSIIQIIDGV